METEAPQDTEKTNELPVLKGQYRGLRPFSKDNQPPRRGRRKGSKSIKDALDRFGALQAPESLIAKVKGMFPTLRKKIDVFDAVILRTYYEAMNGESWAVEFVADRLEGKAVQKTIMGFNSESIMSHLDNIADMITAADGVTVEDGITEDIPDNNETADDTTRPDADPEKIL